MKNKVKELEKLIGNKNDEIIELNKKFNALSNENDKAND